MDEQTRQRMKVLLEELHAVEYHGVRYYEIVEELETVIAEPAEVRHGDDRGGIASVCGDTGRPREMCDCSDCTGDQPR